MVGVDPYQSYHKLAQELFDGQISEGDLPNATAHIHPLDEALLDQLAQRAEEAAHTQPRLGWAIATIADTVARQQEAPLFTQSLAAWYLGRAANHWVQPKRVSEAITRARQGFEKLNETGWIAACDWQENLLSWTKPDLVQAATSLQKALEELQRAGFDSFAPLCHLALAFAQILTSQFEEARENIRASEIVFSAQGDIINQARCWWTESSLLRRQSRFDDALDMLEKTLPIFIRANMTLDIAKVHYQFGLIHLLRIDDLSKAISHFEQATLIFAKSDIDLWQAACTTYLGSIYMQNGRFGKAEKCYQQARVSFIIHNVLGLLADNMNDSGKLNLQRGFPHTSLKQYKQAEEINISIGSKAQVALAIANQGEVYGHLGRYQDALHNLERATEGLIPLKNFLRLGTCEKYIALIWAQLGQFNLAHKHLNQAEKYYKNSEQKALLTTIYNSRAMIFVLQDELVNAIEYLEKTLAIAKAHNLRPQTALARRLLGEALLCREEHSQARENLEEALAAFEEMGMALEQAASLVALGNYFLKASHPDQARASFKQALNLSQGDFPESDWQAYAGLAKLAERQEHPQESIRVYRLGLRTLAKIRHNFWQPTLAGSYFQTSTAFFEQAISLAAQSDQPIDALQFIESGKATILIRRLSLDFDTVDRNAQNLNELKAEIDWLHEQLRASFEKSRPMHASVQLRQLRRRLAETTQQYDNSLTKLERQNNVNTAGLGLSQPFDLDSFRDLANRALGTAWLALDYYRIEKQLVTLVVSPEYFQVHTSSISPRVDMALDACRKASRNAEPPILRDLAILGECLIPTWLAESLTPETVLLLAPHRDLHNLPWSALQPAWVGDPLACLCIPSLIPSLNSLATLWSRTLPYSSSPSKQGLFIGLSKFPGGKEQLPFVIEEIAVMRTSHDAEAQYLLDDQATWENLVSMAGQDHDQGLARFAWMHFACHAFADRRSGRLGGFALWDGDIRLDQLRDLTPLPNLVTFSACNSMYSYIYAGDEHVGLPTTCLTAGANSFLGSVWPVTDLDAAEFTTAFYRYYFAGASPAQATAQAQRELIEEGEKITSWAGFTCMGIP